MPTLNQFIAMLAAEIARDRGWSTARATGWIEARLAEAQAEYRAAGAVLGDTDAGFIAWIRPRYRPPAA